MEYRIEDVGENTFDVEVIDKLVESMRNVSRVRGPNCTNCGKEMYIFVPDEGLNLTKEQIERLQEKGIWVI